MKNIILFATCIFLYSFVNLDAMPAQICIIRNAEKSDQNNSLSLKGKERAAALVPFFMENENLITYGLPAAIYAMGAPTPESSHATFDTVAPLAEQLKLTINDKYEKFNYKKMVDEIKENTLYQGKTVIICWDNAYIPEITRGFSALQSPARWINDVYDKVWIITFTPTGKAIFQNIPQRLMFGDSPK